MRMKLIAVVGAALLLTGCAGQAEVEPTPPEPVDEVSEPIEPTPTPEDAFLTEFKETNPDAGRAEDEVWLDIAYAICDAYDAGASPNQVVDTMAGGNPDEAASLVVLSAEHLCPEHWIG